MFITVLWLGLMMWHVDPRIDRMSVDQRGTFGGRVDAANAVAYRLHKTCEKTADIGVECDIR